MFRGSCRRIRKVDVDRMQNRLAKNANYKKKVVRNKDKINWKTSY